MNNTLLPLLKRITNILPFGRYTLYKYLSMINFDEFVYSTGLSNSFKFVCNLKDPVARVVYFSDIIEPQFISIIENHLKPGMSFVDVGASWGYYTMLASKITGDKGRVIALEPDLRYSILLENNIELNSIKNVTVHKIAAGQCDGFIYMELKEKSSNELWEIPRSVIKTNDDPLDLDAIKCKKLDEILGSSLGLLDQKISFLKMNIEGAEYEALGGMSDGLRNMIYQRMLIEFHPPWLEQRGSSTQVLVKEILSCGYSGWWIRRSSADMRRLMYTRELPNPQDFLLEMESEEPPDQDVWPCAFFIDPKLLMQ